MSWILQTVQWYAVLLGLGICFFPSAYLLMGKLFPDRGYVFAKIIGIVILSYVSLTFGTIHLLSFSSSSLILILGLAAILNLYIAKKWIPVKQFSRNTISLLIFEELLFLISLFFWTYVRGQEPSVRGLEKFMDFGFMSSILRAEFFPPLDMWLSGFPINYYYFGHLMGAVLIKLSGLPGPVGYNLTLSTIFALSVTEVFSLCISLFKNTYTHLKPAVHSGLRYLSKIGILALLGTYVVNFGGNLHTIYLFTKGYPAEEPLPFWNILSGYNPLSYWYPNATRFIPFTIHEFPSYSYVVADLHGHVFGIPIVILILALLFTLCLSMTRKIGKRPLPHLFYIPLFGFLVAIQYMTNALDGPIYLVLTGLIILMLTRDVKRSLLYGLGIGAVFLTATLPFSVHFKPFVSGVGVNCSPDFLVKLAKLGPFLFEKGNCQTSPLWMLFILWGFFFISFLIYTFILLKSPVLKTNKNIVLTRIFLFFLILFGFGMFLIIVPEFFYVKDIYPAHFRANTMFKLGYQAFIFMGISSIYTLFLTQFLPRFSSLVVKLIFVILLVFVVIYPFYSIPAYYGKLDRPVNLDGAAWINTEFPEDREIIEFINSHIFGQPVILEAQGDSYTDYERISSYTGLPTVAGWWVHEWLWRGDSAVVGDRIPDIVALYTSPDIRLTQDLIRKYKIKYVIISEAERIKYETVNEGKFSQLGTIIFTSKNGRGAVYQLN